MLKEFKGSRVMDEIRDYLKEFTQTKDVLRS
jgi:hypothetical protein